jgi:outer membrane protein
MRLRWWAMGLILGVMCAQSAHALEWLLPNADPFATEEKTEKMIDRKLKPSQCGVLDTKQILQLREVVVASLCNNPSTKSAYLSLMGSAASFGTNYAGYLPEASSTVSHSKTTSVDVDGKSTSYTHSYGLSLGMTLYDFGQREFSFQQAERALVAAGYTYNATLQAAIASSLQAYYALVNAQNALEVAKESEAFAKVSYDAALVRHEIGQVALADKLQAKSSYTQATLSVESAYNQLAQSQAALAQVMGLPADTLVEVSDVDEGSLGQDPFATEIRTLMEKAKQKRNDLLASREGLTAAEIAARAQTRKNRATLSATTSMDLGNSSIHLFDRYKTRSQAAGISLSIPIFTGFSNTYTERATQKSLEAQREDLLQAELGVEKDVWDAWHNYQTAKQTWETSADLVASATLLKDVALGRYKEGLGTILDVLSAQSQYRSALQSQLQSRHSLLTSRVDLVRAVGELNLETMQPTATLETPETSYERSPL